MTVACQILFVIDDDDLIDNDDVCPTYVTHARCCVADESDQNSSHRSSVSE